jgi:hypothetical protein
VEIIDSPLATTGSQGRHWVRFTLGVPLLVGICCRRKHQFPLQDGHFRVSTSRVALFRAKAQVSPDLAWGGRPVLTGPRSALPTHVVLSGAA